MYKRTNAHWDTGNQRPKRKKTGPRRTQECKSRGIRLIWFHPPYLETWQSRMGERVGLCSCAARCCISAWEDLPDVLYESISDCFLEERAKVQILSLGADRGYPASPIAACLLQGAHCSLTSLPTWWVPSSWVSYREVPSFNWTMIFPWLSFQHLAPCRSGASCTWA